MLEVVIEGHEERLSFSVAFASLMPRRKEIQERIQAVIEKVKTFHKRQHLANTKQVARFSEKRGYVHHAKDEGKEADDQGDGDYSDEEPRDSRLFLFGHLIPLDPSNKQHVEEQQDHVAEGCVEDVDGFQLRPDPHVLAGTTGSPLFLGLHLHQ